MQKRLSDGDVPLRTRRNLNKDFEEHRMDQDEGQPAKPGEASGRGVEETHQALPQEVHSMGFWARSDCMLDEKVTMLGTEVATAMNSMEVRLTTKLSKETEERKREGKATNDRDDDAMT